MDWDNEQICHCLTAVGLGEYVQVFIGMFVKLGITGKESSAFGSFAFPIGEGKKGGVGVTLVLALLPLNSIIDLISLFQIQFLFSRWRSF
jgi:hypothetical protein